MDAATIIQLDEYRDPAGEINREHDLVLTADADRMEHYIRCGELLLAQKSALPRGQFQNWISVHCKFSYKTAADYMRVAKQKSRGLDFSSLDGMKKKTRKERPAKPIKPRTQGWASAIKDRLGGEVPGFTYNTLVHHKKPAVEAEYGAPVPARIVVGSEEERKITEAFLRVVGHKNQKDATRSGESMDAYKAALRSEFEQQYAKKNAELQQSFCEAVIAEVEKRLPAHAHSEIADAKASAEAAERLEGVWRNRARACKDGAVLLLDNWRLFTLCLHPDRAPDDRRDQFSKATELLLRIRRAFDEVSYDKW